MKWTRVVALSGLVLLLAIFAIGPFSSEPQDSLARANDHSAAARSVDQSALLPNTGRQILKIGGKPIANLRVPEMAAARSQSGDCSWQAWHGDLLDYAWTEPDGNMATDRFVRFETAGQCTLMSTAIAIYGSECVGTPTARVRIYGNNGPIHDNRMYPGDDDIGPGDPSNLVAEMDIPWTDLTLWPSLHTIDWTSDPGWPANFAFGPDENVFVSLSLSPNTPNPGSDVIATLSDNGLGGGDSRSGAYYLEMLYLYNDAAFGTDYGWLTEAYFCCGGNEPPVFQPISNQLVYEGEHLLFTVAAVDPDRATLHYYTGPLPENAAFISETQEFSWMPGWDQEGEYEVTFYVSDGSLEDTASISVTVLPSRYGPAIIPLGRNYVRQGGQVKILLGRNVIGSTFEIEDDVQSIMVSGLPSGMTYDATDTSLTWDVPASASGEYGGITVTVTDDDGKSDMTTGSIVVMPQLPLGDLDGEGFITPLDLANQIDCLFGGYCARPLDNYDFNANGFADPLDLPIMIDHLFASGPPPYEKPRVDIGRPGVDGLVVGPLTTVAATDVSSAPISNIYFEYSLDGAAWFPIDTTDTYPPDVAALAGRRIERYWNTEELPPGPAWLRAISVDSIHHTADTAVVSVVINSPPVADHVIHYDPVTRVAVFDMRTSYDPDGTVDPYAKWRFTNDTLDLTLHGPVVQLYLNPGDSLGFSGTIDDLDGADATLAYCADVTEDEILITVQPDCRCLSIEVLSNGSIALHNQRLYRRARASIRRMSSRERVEQYGWLRWEDIVQLGPMVDLSHTADSYGTIRFRFLVHITFEGDASGGRAGHRCEWGQKVQRTSLGGGVVTDLHKHGETCPHDNPSGVYCPDNYNRRNRRGHLMEITKSEVWWSDAPGVCEINDAGFDEPGRPEDLTGVELNANFIAWASPKDTASPCCTAFWEVNFHYDKNKNPEPNPGGEPTISPVVTPSPATPMPECESGDEYR